MINSRSSRLAIALAVLASASWACAMSARPAGAATPGGFTDELVAAVGGPTALAFTPDGRMLVTTQGGAVRVVQGGALLPDGALDLSPKLCANSERGLLGVAVDPAFLVNRFVYLFYTFNRHGVCEQNTARAPVNRVSRFVLGDSNSVDPSSETILLDNIPSPAGNHNAGDLAFGKDGYLYVTVGDGGCDYAGGGCAGSNDASRDQHVLLGKILRITRDGGIPPDNPFLGVGSAPCALTGSTTPGGTCQETFAWGLRNPFRFAFDPNAVSTRFFVNDVGQGAWEEIDLGQAGADYGWNVREGHCANGSLTNCGPPPAGMTNPIYDYDHGSGCRSITGGAFIPSGMWPAPYDGAYLFADYICGAIFRLDPDGAGGYTRAAFVTDLGGGSAVHLAFGGTGTGGDALFYTTYSAGGQVRRVMYTGTTCLGSAATHVGTTGTDTLVGTTGNDVIVGLAGSDTIDGRGGDDKICGGEGLDLVTYADSPAGVSVDLLTSPSKGSGWGSDSLVSIENVTGSSFADTLVGSTRANVLTGRDGNDNLRSAGGNDNLLGGPGEDFLRDGAGNDRVDGGEGVDTLDYSVAPGGVTVNLLTAPFTSSGWGSDSLASVENVNGSPYRDALVGSTGANVLNGLGGEDDVRGAAGNDAVNGGTGSDFVRGNLGDDSIAGGDGIDTADYANATGGVSVNLLATVPGLASGQGSDELTGIENLTGSAYADQLVGDANANVLSGLGGADDLRGAPGNDMVSGGADNDFLRGNPGDDALDGGEGVDTADFANAASGVSVNLAMGAAGGQGTDSLAGIENVTGSPYRDILVGNSLGNLLRGEAGDDDLDGGFGFDTCVQGPGSGLIQNCEA